MRRENENREKRLKGIVVESVSSEKHCINTFICIASLNVIKFVGIYFSLLLIKV